MRYFVCADYKITNTIFIQVIWFCLGRVQLICLFAGTFIFVVELHCYFTLEINFVEILILNFKDYSRSKNSFGYLDFGFNLVYFIYLHLSN